MKMIYGAVLAVAFAAPAFAESHSMGDAAAGEKEFGKCKACHAIVDDAGETIQRGGKVGPNLYNVVGRKAGAVEDYKYGKSMVEAGEGGLVWDEANLAAYLEDPNDFLKTTLDDNKARSKMSFKLRKGREDVAAYLASVSPAAEGMEEAPKTE
ncbi:c-type cytochrome [Roseobacter sp. GAI101]|uniref:c-type cytochrome n=1 Tax=Roseobacter sp. (strain GAI101) TaxID=391589 RepID=UPI00018718A6|nr:cytochrome c550 [Roseobacter sp. GAI101]EEB83488.1 cytochrome c-551 [Roseobacter sp. GAI101]